MQTGVHTALPSGLREITYHSEVMTRWLPINHFPRTGRLWANFTRAQSGLFMSAQNPRRLFLAAHSIRELTKELTKVLDLPVLIDHGRMRDRLDAWEKTWNRALASSCNQGGAWRGEILRCGNSF